MPYAEPLDDGALASALGGLTDWERDGATIRRTVKLRGFKAAVAFVNAVAEAADAANHHPDILIHGYNRVTLTLTTHDAGAVTRRDVDLAATIDALVPD